MSNKSDAATIRELMDLFGPGGDRWTQGEAACDADGEPVPPHSANARCCCLSGGMVKVIGSDRSERFHKVRRFLILAVNRWIRKHTDEPYGLEDIADFNDEEGRTWDHVREMLADAAATADE